MTIHIWLLLAWTGHAFPSEIRGWSEYIQWPADFHQQDSMCQHPPHSYKGPAAPSWGSSGLKVSLQANGLNRGQAKPSLKSQGQMGAAAGGISKSEKNFSNVYPSSHQLSGQDATHSLLVPKDTNTCHFLQTQTQEQGKKPAAFGLWFRGPQKKQALEIMPLLSLLKLIFSGYIFLSTKKSKVQRPSAQEIKCKPTLGTGVISIRGPHSSQTSGRSPAICSDGLMFHVTCCKGRHFNTIA